MPEASGAIAPERPEWTQLPPWLRRPIGKASEISTVQRIIKQRQIYTICEEGRCPNRGGVLCPKNRDFFADGADLHALLRFLPGG